MDKGSVIQIEYTLYDVEADIVIETNRVGEHESTGDGDADTSQEARPLTTIVGSGRLIPGFEEHLEEAEEGRGAPLHHALDVLYKQNEGAPCRIAACERHGHLIQGCLALPHWQSPGR